MSWLENNPDRRRSFRYPVAPPRQPAELKLGSVRLPVRLLNESAEGFGVLADDLPALETDDVAELHTMSGGYKVRVVYVVQVSPLDTEDEYSEEAGAPPPTFRLGLHRLGELDLLEEGEDSRAGRHIRFLLAMLIPSRAYLVAQGRMFVAVSVVVLLGAAGLLWSVDHPLVKPTERHSHRVSTSSPSSGTSRGRGHRASRRHSRTPKRAAGSRGSSRGSREAKPTTRSAADGVDELYQTVQRLPGATALCLPEVVEQLELTAAQQEQIRGLVERTAQTMQEVNLRWPAASRQQLAEIRTGILNAARRQALDLLSGQQRARWEERFQ